MAPSSYVLSYVCNTPGAASPALSQGKYSYQGPSLGLGNKDWLPNTIPNNPGCMHLVCFLSIRQATF